jgi:2-desacetyl-2-hydroxyethyl bacteriochlorophyllide A dehydrogenase
LKTLLLKAPFIFQHHEQEMPDDLRSGEALVKIGKIGICGTDYHAFRGKQPFFNYPRILGHELGGEVVALEGDAGSVQVGDNVTIEPYMNCGKCQSCKNGKSNCCENLEVLGVHMDGGMAEYLKVPSSKLHVSKILSLEQLAVVEPLSIGSHAVQRAQVSAKDLVLVIGAGPIGLSVMLFAKITGATVVVMDMNRERLDFAKQQVGVDAIINVADDISMEKLRGYFDNYLPTVVFDATGNPGSMKNAFNYVCFGGKLVFVGLFIGDVVFEDPLFHRRELTLLASRNSLPQDFSAIIKLMETGKIDIGSWLTHRADFDVLPGVFNEWQKPESGVIKAVVTV